MVTAPPYASGVSSAGPPRPAPVVQTKRRPDLAMLAGWVCSEEARPRRQGPIGIVGEAARAVQSAERTACDGNADRARTFQGCLLRNRSQAQKTAGVKPALLLPF